MLHDYGEYRENVIMPNVKKYTFADVKSSLSTVGAVTPVPMDPTSQILGLAVREPMRLEGTNVVCTHTSLCMVALSISTALISP